MNPPTQSSNRPLYVISDTPDQLAFVFANKTVTLDLIEAELKIESLAADNPSPEQLLPAIKEWFHQDYEIKLSTTQAWQLFHTVRSGFLAHKKKLADALLSPSGITLTPSNSLPLKSKFSFANFLLFWRKRNYANDKPQPP